MYFGILIALALFPLSARAAGPPTPREDKPWCALPLETISGDGAGEMRGVIVASPVEAGAPVEDWIKKGVNLHITDPRVKNRGRFISRCSLTDLKINERYLIHNSPTEDIKAMKWAWDFTYDVKHAELFEKTYGFKPSQENFTELERIAEQFDEYEATPRTQVFPPYEQIRGVRVFPPDFPESLRDGVKGIQSLWNDPEALLKRMDDVKALVAEKRAANTALRTSEALEQVRQEVLGRHGFSKSVHDNLKTVSTEKWHEFISQEQPTLMRDVSGSHSLEYVPHEGQNIHRDQWLLIALEMEKNPARFGVHPPRASELFRHLGNPELISLLEIPEDASVHGGQFSTQNPWYLLFDYITDKFRVANAANPFYFNEIFTKRTGFDPAW